MPQQATAADAMAKGPIATKKERADFSRAINFVLGKAGIHRRKPTKLDAAFAASLPRPTKDEGRIRADLTKWGYAYVGGALTPAQLAEVRTRVVEQAEGERMASVAIVDGGKKGGVHPNQRVWSLINKGDVFQELAQLSGRAVREGPLIERTVRWLLKSTDYILHSFHCNIASPGSTAMGLHVDQGWVPMPHPETPVLADILYFVDDFLPRNGGTWLIPGSHKLACRTKDEFRAHDFGPVVAATAPAGTALIYDGRLVHGTGANDMPPAAGALHSTRHGIIALYSAPWVRQQENFALQCPPRLLPAMSPKLRKILGFQPWGTLGSVEGNGIQAGFSGKGEPEYVRLSETPVLQLGPSSRQDELEREYSVRATRYNATMQHRVRRNAELRAKM